MITIQINLQKLISGTEKEVGEVVFNSTKIMVFWGLGGATRKLCYSRKNIL